MSNYVVFPFAGGWLDQPQWLRADFMTLLRVRRWWQLNQKLPTTEGLPKLEDA